MNIPIKDAKELFEELVRRAEAGEHVIVTRDGKPVAEIGPATVKSGGTSLLGAMKGQIWMAPDFDELGPEWDEYVK